LCATHPSELGRFEIAQQLWGVFLPAALSVPSFYGESSEETPPAQFRRCTNSR